VEAPDPLIPELIVRVHWLVLDLGFQDGAPWGEEQPRNGYLPAGDRPPRSAHKSGTTPTWVALNVTGLPRKPYSSEFVGDVSPIREMPRIRTRRARMGYLAVKRGPNGPVSATADHRR
jgi:hypothetical protein